jgi:hypothetical protein
MPPSGGIFNDYPELEEVKKWLLKYARNANKPIPVESAITMIKLNAPRRRPSMRSPNHVTSHQEERRVEGVTIRSNLRRPV